MRLTNIQFRLGNCLFSDRSTSVHNYLQIITMFSWLIIMSNTSSMYVIYLFLGLCAFWCRSHYNENKRAIFSKKERANLIIACIFSVVLIMANYDISSIILSSIIKTIASPIATQLFSNHFLLISNLIFFFCFPWLFLGGTYISFFILRFVTEKLVTFSWAYHPNTISSRKLFLRVFGLIGALYSAVFFLGFYPGIISNDSINQLTQIVTGNYTNWHPFYHTNLIRFFVFIGTSVLHDINAGVALYSLFSIILMSACFSYAVVTLYQLNINKKIILAVSLIYMLMPHHILYSFTMWKDVPFSASVLLFTISAFRYFRKIGQNNTLDMVLLALGAFGICLFRGNGLIVMFILIIISVIFFRKKAPGICLSMVCILVVSLILSYPVLNSFNIEQADTAEVMSLQFQQISRTLIENDDIPQDQLELISKIADPEGFRNVYESTISNPIKYLIREGNQDYLKTHKWEFIKLYLKMGIAHPRSYLAAWIDQTRGYWNGGYVYWRFGFLCQANDLGVKRTTVSGIVEKGIFGYAELFEYFDLLRPFVSIGLHTWLILLVAYIGYRKKNKLTVFLTVPCLAIIFTLLIGTPVFAEFRYAYALFCCLPFLAVITFRRNDDKTDTPPITQTLISGDAPNE